LEREPAGFPAYEARENLRVIRSLMERSTRYSTFSGPSGIFAGSLAVIGCLVHWFFVRSDSAMLCVWFLVAVGAVTGDYLLMKRRARLVGKTIFSHLGRQILSAALPGLGIGAFLTLYLISIGRLSDVFPFWMLSYGAAVSAVGLFSQREVGRLGRAFVAAGAVSLTLKAFVPADSWIPVALFMTAASFGGFHILYGLEVNGRDDR
jgi:hypothetical protein